MGFSFALPSPLSTLSHDHPAAVPFSPAPFGGFRTGPYNGDGPYASQLQRVSASRWRAAAFEFPGHTSQLVAIAYCA